MDYAPSLKINPADAWPVAAAGERRQEVMVAIYNRASGKQSVGR
jgi:hypothetical protein